MHVVCKWEMLDVLGLANPNEYAHNELSRIHSQELSCLVSYLLPKIIP